MSAHLCMLGYFLMILLSSADLFQNIFFFKKIFQEHYQNVKQFGSRACYDLDTNLLQWLAADKLSLAGRELSHFKTITVSHSKAS